MNTKLKLDEGYVGTVTVGERGQIVIPAEARKRMEIHTGDTLLVMGHPNKEGLMLFKLDAVREFLNHLTEGLSMAEAVEAQYKEVEDSGNGS